MTASTAASQDQQKIQQVDSVNAAWRGHIYPADCFSFCNNALHCATATGNPPPAQSYF